MVRSVSFWVWVLMALPCVGVRGGGECALTEELADGGITCVFVLRVGARPWGARATELGRAFGLLHLPFYFVQALIWHPRRQVGAGRFGRRRNVPCVDDIVGRHGR